LSKRFRGTRSIPVPLPGFLQRYSRGRPQDELRLDDDPDDEEDFEEDEEDEVADEAQREEIWALRDLSLAVDAGTVLGVIGPNGSGKSTLVRVLGGMTPVTEGQVTLRGRVAPPLNVASRFIDANATGRQNVFILANLFRVPRPVAERQMDTIAEFAEVAHLLDTPVRGYSPGLIRRLGLSIAFHFEPHILLADEFPSAGDVHFRDRCRAWLEAQARSGLTMVLASHDMRTIRQLCNDVIWLDQGRIVERGAPDALTERYEGTRPSKREARAAGGQSSDGTAAGPGAVLGAGIFSTTGHPISSLDTSDDAVLELSLRLNAGLSVKCTAQISLGGERALSGTQPEPFTVDHAGEYTVTAYLPPRMLGEGRYEVGLRASVYEQETRSTVLRADPFFFEAYGALPETDPEPAGRKQRRPRLSWAVTREGATD
jgi:ABC-2 type transport system ATP-binding protein